MAVVTLFDKEMREIGPIMCNADIETGNAKCTNDFETSNELPQNCYGMCVLGTDAGGVIEYVESSGTGAPIKKGWTWRGLLTQAIICPPSGKDYYTIANKDLNAVIKEVLGNVLGGFFTVPNTQVKTVTSYQFERYTDCLTGLMDICRANGHKLYVHAEKSDELRKVIVVVEAKPIMYMEGEYTEDSTLKLSFKKNRMGINHMICMGQGELAERQRVDLYLQQDGTIGKTKYYSGFEERQYYYDDSSASDLATLEKEGREYFPEITSKNELIIMSEPENLEVGDVVRGTYKAEGIKVEAMVTKKIYRINGNIMDVEYATEEETR